MTYIEFFTRTATENICACLANVPDRVILIGDRLDLMEQHAQRYRELLGERGYRDVEFVCRTVNKSDLGVIVSVLSDIVNEYPDSVFDLTGGEELYLVAAGIIKERFAHKGLSMHYFNISSNKITDCDNDGVTIADGAIAQLTVEENIRAHGGDIVYDTTRPDGTHRWVMDEEFIKDIGNMWDLCKKDIKKWNIQMGIFMAADVCAQEESGPCYIQAEISDINDYLDQYGSYFSIFDEIVKELEWLGLIKWFSQRNGIFRIEFKNEQIRKCLTKAGMALEMMVFSTAYHMQGTDGKRMFCDVMNGVCIDWDGKISLDTKGDNVENEIDVMMMQGLVPVFVSCKNGFLQVDELYKLNSVAERFGKQYARKILVSTMLDPESEFGKYFSKRAESMGISVISGIQNKGRSALESALRDACLRDFSIKSEKF